MVHTVSGIVLHRLYRMMRTGDAPAETRAVVEAMVALVQAARPGLLRPHRPGAARRGARSSRRGCPRLDGRRRRRGGAARRAARRRASRCWSTTCRAPRRRPPRPCAPCWARRPRRSRTTRRSSELLNPGLNRYRLETLQLSVHSPLARAMHHASYTFLKKLSHTADSQDQRHRMVPASRPLMTLTDTRAARLRHAAAGRRQRRGARRLPGGDGAGLGRQEPPARAGRPARDRALPAAEREGAALPRERAACSTSRTSG